MAGAAPRKRYNIAEVIENRKKPAAIDQPPAKTRCCLRCRKDFLSRGLFMCPKCHDEIEAPQNTPLSKRAVGGYKMSSGSNARRGGEEKKAGY